MRSNKSINKFFYVSLPQIRFDFSISQYELKEARLTKALTCMSSLKALSTITPRVLAWDSKWGDIGLRQLARTWTSSWRLNRTTSVLFALSFKKFRSIHILISLSTFNLIQKSSKLDSIEMFKLNIAHLSSLFRLYLHFNLNWCPPCHHSLTVWRPCWNCVDLLTLCFQLLSVLLATAGDQRELGCSCSCYVPVSSV